MRTLSLEGRFWRSAAQWGASRMPEWFVRGAPVVIGLCICAAASERRGRALRSLRRVRGARGRFRDAVDVGRVFAGYAACLTETLSAGSGRRSAPDVVVHGELHTMDALADRRGVILVTAHTAGWESVGLPLTRDLGLRIMIGEAPEPDAGARAIQDEARRRLGLLVTHVGDDPLSALPLARHLREGGAVALQIDRLAPGQKSCAVALFGSAARIPEGPLRLAMLTGAPLLPVFAARTGHRRYEVHAYRPLRLPRSASAWQVDAAAQDIADAMDHFVRAHPTQWFDFGALSHHGA